MKIQITTQVTKGKLTRNRNQLTEAIKSFEGKTITITIDKAKKKRSNPQNSFYYGVVIPIMRDALKEAGHIMTNDDVHQLLKLKFLKETILTDENTGECIERIKSTTELSTTGFMEYILEIQQWCSEFFGIVIPDPNEQLKIE